MKWEELTWEIITWWVSSWNVDMFWSPDAIWNALEFYKFIFGLYLFSSLSTHIIKYKQEKKKHYKESYNPISDWF